MNMTPENRAHFESEKEAIHLILTGIGDEIYSTVDACQTAQEMWEAIERLQQVHEQAQRDKDKQKKLLCIAKVHLRKSTNLPTTTSELSSITRNTMWRLLHCYKNDNQTGQFRNQRAVNVVGTKETVGGQVV
ncbi:hypothetical protein Tco_0432343 [Tanacetum coccineum]